MSAPAMDARQVSAQRARERRAEKTSPWRWFPLGLLLSMAVVFAVNGVMIYSALSTFPGETSNGFEESNSYNAVLDHAAREAAMGWQVRAAIDQGHPIIALTGPDSAALTGATLSATAQRPLGAKQTSQLAFSEIAPGRYEASTALTEPGQWDVLLEVRRGGQLLHVSRRVVLK